jgi:hypothetical protein
MLLFMLLSTLSPLSVPAFADETGSESQTTEVTGDGATDDSATDDGATDDGATDDGATDDGATDDGATDDGATDDGATDDGATDDGATDDSGDTEENFDAQFTIQQEVEEIAPYGVCRATGAAKNPWVFISPNSQSYAAHLEHLGIVGGDRIATQAEFDAGRCFVEDEPDLYPFDVDKYFCTLNVDTAPNPEIGVPGENCVEATEGFELSLYEGNINLQIPTESLLAGVMLEEGTYQLYEGEFALGSITIPDVEHVDVLNFIAEPEGSVSVSKYVCEGLEEVTGGIDMAAPVDGCVESTAVFDILDSESNSVLGEGDVFAGVTLPGGNYTLVELGTGFEVPFTIAAESNIQINVFNPAEEEEPWITILKRFCEGDNSEGNVSNCNGREAPDVDVTFTVVGNGVDDTIVVEEFNQGNSSQGQASSDFDLEAGETYLVCEIEPDGWMGVARALGANQTAGETPNCVYVTLTPGNNVVQFNNFMRDVPVDETGTLIVTKYFCTDEGLMVPVVGDEGDYKYCEPGATAEQFEGVNFWVYPGGNAAAAIDIDDNALLSTGVVLPVGTHTLVEVLDGVTHVLDNFEIKAGETTTIVVFNPVEKEDENGTLIVKKYFCKDKDLKHPTVGTKGDYDHCKPAKPSSVEFYVLAFGETKVDLDESTLLSTGVTLPAGTHELFEVFKGKAYSLGEFKIEVGETTTITVFNPAKYDKPDHEKPDYDKPGADKPGTPGGTTASTGGTTAVTTLPSTGSGAEASNDAIASLTLLPGAAALAGTGMLLRKERPGA